MSAHILLNLSTDLGKKIKCEACRAFYLLFATSFVKFNDTRARILDSFYHMTFKLFYNYVFGVKTSRFCQLYAMFT